MKLIIIDDNEGRVKVLKEICDELDIDSFPSELYEKSKFNTIKNLIYSSIEYSVFREDVKKKLSKILNEFIGNAESFAFLISYEFEDKHNINGIGFYKLFAENQKTIFLTESENTAKVFEFCKDKKNCFWIIKENSEWNILLRSILLHKKNN